MTSPSLSDILLVVRKNVTYVPDSTVEERVNYHAGWQDALTRVEAVLKALGVEINTV